MLQESLSFLRTILLSRMHKHLLECLLNDTNFQLNSVWFKRLTMLQEKCNLPILHSIAVSKNGRRLESVQEQYQEDLKPLEREGLIQYLKECPSVVKITSEGEKFIYDLSCLMEHESRLQAMYI